MNRLRRGMSFFEISIVVLIVGILAAIVTPQFARSTRFQNTRNASVQLANYINYVREVAINEGRSTSIVVDADGDLFYSPDVSFPDRVGTAIWVPVKSLYDGSLEITGTFDGETTLSFDLEGVPSVGGSPLVSGVIRIASQDVIYDIMVDGGTGLPTVAVAKQSPSDDLVKAGVEGSGGIAL